MLFVLSIEHNLDLDLGVLVDAAIAAYTQTTKLENPETKAQVLNFIQERLRGYEIDRGVSVDIFNAVAALMSPILWICINALKR